MENKEILNNWIEEQENYYNVFVDGNNHQETRGKRILTEKRIMTLSECKALVEKIEKNLNIIVNKIEINMSIFDYKSLTADDVDYVLSGDIGVRCLINKKMYYYKNENRLIVWQDGLPIYENYDGQICKDAVALADCLC
jgi:hypothetical protein